MTNEHCEQKGNVYGVWMDVSSHAREDPYIEDLSLIFSPQKDACVKGGEEANNFILGTFRFVGVFSSTSFLVSFSCRFCSSILERSNLLFLNNGLKNPFLSQNNT